MRLAPAALAGALAALAVAATPRAQEAALPDPLAQQPELLLPSGVELVRLEVVVTEKRRPRVGLRREDFVVLEDGKPQEIVQFQSFVGPSALPGPAASPGEPTTSAPADAAPRVPEGASDELPTRYVVLAIDDVHMQFDSLVRVRKALERFLEEDLRPEDQVALVTTSGASALSQEFTSDRAALLDVLSRLSAQGRKPEWSDIPYISDYQAERIEAGDPFALDAAADEILQAGILQDRPSAEQMARDKARRILAEAIYDARLTLEAIESVCRGLAGLTGRKALFLVSDGFVTGVTSGSGATFDVRRIVDAATRAGVTVHALDTRGLVASMPIASASSLRRPSPASAGTIENMRQQAEQASREAMNALASDTGGLLVENVNDLRVGLRTLLKDTDTYYVLAYEPTNAKRDGGFRRIDVKLPGVSGVKARTRAGYFAPDDRGLASLSASIQAQTQQAEQRRAEMQTALRSLAPLTAIPLRLSAEFVNVDGASSQVLVSGSIDVSTLPFLRRDARRQGTVEAVAVVYDDAGAAVATLPTERSALDLTDEDYERVRRSGVPYRQAAPLRPGRYQVRFAAREETTGMLGSTWQKLEVPDLAGGRLAMSGVFLLKEDPSGTATGATAGPPLTSVMDRPRFGPDERLYLQFYVYNLRRGPDGTVDAVAQAEVLRGGSSVALAAPETLVAEGAGPLAHLSRIRPQRLAPGDYDLRVTVTDRAGGAMLARTVSFSVE
jgi:VWFA-related protein